MVIMVLPLSQAWLAIKVAKLAAEAGDSFPVRPTMMISSTPLSADHKAARLPMLPVPPKMMQAAAACDVSADACCCNIGVSLGSYTSPLSDLLTKAEA